MGLAIPNISVKKYLKLMNSGWRKTNRATMKKLLKERKRKYLVGWVREGDAIVDLSKIQDIPDKEYKIKIRLTIEKLK